MRLGVSGEVTHFGRESGAVLPQRSRRWWVGGRKQNLGARRHWMAVGASERDPDDDFPDIQDDPVDIHVLRRPRLNPRQNALPLPSRAGALFAPIL